MRELESVSEKNRELDRTSKTQTRVLGCASKGPAKGVRRSRTTPKGLEYASERGLQGGRKHDTVAHTDHGVRESSTVY